MTTVDRLYSEAMELQPEEQEELLDRLLAARCDQPDDAWWKRIEPELDQISASMDSGQMQPVGLEEVQRRMRERIARNAH